MKSCLFLLSLVLFGLPFTAYSVDPPPPLREALVVEVTVQPHALNGEDWRASQNFSLAAPAGTQRLLWKIKDAQPNQHIKFSVAEDIPLGSDPTHLRNIVHGSNTALITGDNVDTNRLYFGGIEGASAPFVVQIFALVRR